MTAKGRLDAETLAALRRGDRATLDDTLRSVAPAVFRLARSLLGAGHPDLDDAVQESLIAVGKALPAFANHSSVTRYAVRIATRHVLRVAKRRHRYWSGVEGAVEPDDLWSERSSGVHTSEPDHRRTTTLRLLSDLPPEQAEALVLRGFFGLSLAEVAEASGAPANTIRSRVRLAREAIKARLQDDAELAALFDVG